MLTTVSAYTDPIQAHIVRGRLETEGIPAHVAFQHHIWMNWSLSFALGQVRIQVPPSYVRQSLAVLADIRAGKYSDVVETEYEGPYNLPCPDCGSHETRVSRWSGKLALLLLFALLLPLPYSNHRWRCSACGHRWLARDSRPYPQYLYVVGGAAFMGLIFLVCTFLDYMCSVRFWVQSCYSY
jgi:hypothetical protein